MKTSTRVNGAWRSLRVILRYRIRSIVYANPILLEIVEWIFGRNSKNQNKNFWNHQLGGPWSSYVEGNLHIHTRSALIGMLIAHARPGASSLLDVGCGGGNLALALAKNSLERYEGVDLSAISVSKARERVSRLEKIKNVRFHEGDLCNFAPEDGILFDVIVFNEVLYYLGVKECVKQMDRYLNWLRPNGIFCISMKDDPKSHAIFRRISGKIRLINSFLFQFCPNGKLTFRVKINRESPAFLIGIFCPMS